MKIVLIFVSMYFNWSNTLGKNTNDRNMLLIRLFLVAWLSMPCIHTAIAFCVIL